MKAPTIITLFSLILISCTTKPKSDLDFDSELWKESDGGRLVLDTRKRMVNKLLDNQILLNKTEKQIEDLIGYSSKLNLKNDGNKKYYAVQEIYKIDIDPEKMFFLEVTFNNLKLCESVKLIETK